MSLIFWPDYGIKKRIDAGTGRFPASCATLRQKNQENTNILQGHIFYGPNPGRGRERDYPPLPIETFLPSSPWSIWSRTCPDDQHAGNGHAGRESCTGECHGKPSVSGTPFCTPITAFPFPL